MRAKDRIGGGLAALGFVLFLSLPSEGRVQSASDPAYDNFERSSLGSNWTVYNGNPGIVNGSDLGLLTNFGLNVLAWNVSTFSADQFSQITISLDGAPGTPVLASVRGAKPAPGDTLRIEAQGSTLRGYHNGVLILTTTDTVLTAPGQPGIAMTRGSTTSFPTPIVESWTGGSLPSSTLPVVSIAASDSSAGPGRFPGTVCRDLQCSCRANLFSYCNLRLDRQQGYAGC